ncbi:hypothetical protein Tco_1303941 [Tanacetum coccineum]
MNSTNYTRPQRQPFQQHNYGGEDSDVENEYEDEQEVRGMSFGHRGAADFNYHQLAKDVPTFHGSINVEDFLDWMSELDTFFKFYEIPMDNRVNLVAYKLKGGAKFLWKNLKMFTGATGNFHKHGLCQLLRHFSTSKPEGSESVQKLSTLGTGKPTGILVSKSTSTNSYARPEKSSSTNPYTRPVIGKCFKCGATWSIVQVKLRQQS